MASLFGRSLVRHDQTYHPDKGLSCRDAEDEHCSDEGRVGESDSGISVESIEMVNVAPGRPGTKVHGLSKMATGSFVATSGMAIGGYSRMGDA